MITEARPPAYERSLAFPLKLILFIFARFSKPGLRQQVVCHPLGSATMCADFCNEGTSAKARRRKSLAQAMKLVDNAIANLEGVSASPEGGDGGASPASPTHRRRRSTLAGKMFEQAEDESGASGGAGGRRKSGIMRRLSSFGGVSMSLSGSLLLSIKPFC